MAKKKAARRFLRLLDDLQQRRAGKLRRMVVGGTKGPKREFSGKVRSKLTRKMMDAAGEVLVRRYARPEFRKTIGRGRQRHIKGHGIKKRFDCIWEWAKRKLDGPIVYTFWRGKKCLYAGKGNSYRRLWSYRKTIYLKEADLLEVWEVKKRELPKVECLAVHLFEPRYNEVKPARVKYSKKCPVCQRLRKIKRELRSLFRLKKG